MSHGLTDDQRARYARQLALPQVGEEGQLRLASARVTVVGAGGLGSPVLLYLAAAGVGRITVVDPDQVDLSNLQRQVIHDTHALGRDKVHSAARRMQGLNPGVSVSPHGSRLTAHNAVELLEGSQVVLCCTDDLSTRYLVDDTCAELGIPHVYGAILGFAGQVAVFGLPHGPRLRDVFPSPPQGRAAQECSVAGVLGTVPGVIGALMAHEALKLLLGAGEPLRGLLVWDGLDMRFETFTPIG